MTTSCESPQSRWHLGPGCSHHGPGVWRVMMQSLGRALLLILTLRELLADPIDEPTLVRNRESVSLPVREPAIIHQQERWL